MPQSRLITGDRSVSELGEMSGSRDDVPSEMHIKQEGDEHALGQQERDSSAFMDELYAAIRPKQDIDEPSLAQPEDNSSAIAAPPAGDRVPLVDVSEGSQGRSTPDTANSSKKRKLSTQSAADDEIASRPKQLKAQEATQRQEKERLKLEEKQRKVAEREEKQRLKEIEKLEKAAELEEKRRQKAAALEEKRRLDEDKKRQKAVEVEEKRRVKEAEKRAKEEVKQRKVAEQTKKDRSQLRLNAFFPDTKTSPKKARSTSVTSDVKNLSLDLTGSSQPHFSRSPSISEDGSTMAPQSYFHRHFKPFQVKPGVTMAPPNPFVSARGLVYIANSLDQTVLNQTGYGEPGMDDETARQARLSELRALAGWRDKYRAPPTAKEVVLAFQRSAEGFKNGSSEVKKESETDPMDLLDALPIKYISFHDSRRPPYVGTFSKRPPPNSALRWGKNPFKKDLPGVDYDHDSDAEWELEQGDGEELMSEGDDEMDIDADADMAGFLDDTEGDMKSFDRSHGRIVNGDLVPFSSGLWWEDVHGTPRPVNPEDAESGIDMNKYKLEVINDRIQGPIDPFSTAYWDGDPAPAASATMQITALADSDLPGQGFYPQNPSRNHPSIVPLGLTTGLPSTAPSDRALRVSRGGKLKTQRLTLNDSDIDVSGRGETRWKDGKITLSPGLLNGIIGKIRGSNLKKAGLVENLKMMFPMVHKDVIYEVVGTVAERVGQREPDKRWRIKDGW